MTNSTELKRRNIIPMPKEIYDKRGYWGVSSSNDCWRLIDKDGYILESKGFNEVPKTWNTWLHQRCGCMEIHEEQVKCAICGKKDFSLCYYPTNKNHYCLKDAATSIVPQHNSMMKEKYGVKSTKEMLRDTEEIIEKINNNPLMRLANLLFGEKS